MTDAAIIPLSVNHFSVWQTLYYNYAKFYKSEINEEIITTTWGWIMTDKIHGIGIELESQLVGFAHWQQNLRPLKGCSLAYLNDLYILPECRGKGLARQLMQATSEAAANANSSILRWATKQDNAPARLLYDKIATATDWVIYDKSL